MKRTLGLPHRLSWLFFFFGVVALGGVVPSGSVYADNRPPYNSAESAAMSLCGSDRRGAIWFTSDAGNYYTDSVTVVGDQNSVDVYIRGSVYSCAQSGTAHTGAVDVAPQGANGWRLTGLGSTELDRGTVSGRNNWSSQGGQITAKLNVSGLATNNNGRTDSQTITIDLYRCFYNYTSRTKGTCYAQTISVTVNRAPRPDPAPVYNLEQVTCTVASGWILDTSRPNQAMAAHVQVDGDTKVWGTTDQFRGDVNAAYGVGGNHGFSINIARWVADTSPHRVEVFTYNVDSSGNTTGGPISIGAVNLSGCYNYDIYPKTTVSSSVITYGQTATIDARIFNNGTTASKQPVPRTVYEFVLNSGRQLSDYLPNAANPQKSKQLKNFETVNYIEPLLVNYGLPGTTGCSQWAASLSISTCTMPGQDGVTNGIVSVVPASDSWQSTGIGAAATTISADNYDVGQTVCRFLAIRVFDEAHETVGGVNNFERRVSWPACVKIGKKPKVQVLGSDLLSGGLVQTSVATTSTGTFGSWGEYLVTASGTVSGMASARGYAGGAASNVFCSVSYLTLTNASGGTCSDTATKGSYSRGGSAQSRASALSALFTQATALGGSPTIDVASQAAGTYSATGTITVRASGQVPTGKAIIINAPSANVVIADSIRYAGGNYNGLADIPQVVIIASNISIAGGVGQVDAWLVTSGASGTLNTCTDVAAANALRSTNCATPLTVNGPVITQRLLLYRTAGSGKAPASGDPAEVFNLRPDAYMWLSYRQSLAPKAQTVISKELPPRF